MERHAGNNVVKSSAMNHFLLLFSLLVLLASVSVTNSAGKCSWDNCPKWSDNSDIINVHIISHTHDDMGWLKTVDDYYTGRNDGFAAVGVQYIFNTVIDELLKDPSRRFCYAETGFLQRYLENQPAEQLERLHHLIYETGQLELVGGGWVQPDEAATHYYEIIDQYTLGLSILKKKYGECGVSKVGWQLDPFGHSREHANLLAMMGYDALYFSRQHFSELNRRIANKTLEFIWNTSDDLKKSIFTQTFYTGIYAEPQGFCFDALCHDDPIIDNPDLEGYNAFQKAEEFLTIVNLRKEAQVHNHVLMPMGNDFHYSNANKWFTNLDKLIKAVHNASHAKVNVFYSTPACYITAVQDTYAKFRSRLTQKSYDFFPHANNDLTYWTGYFTSKPALKRQIRSGSALLQLMRQFNVLAFNFAPREEERLERAVSLSVHHDGVTGTAKEFVSNDYTTRLFCGRKAAETTLADSLTKLIVKKDASLPSLVDESALPVQHFCWLMNETVCDTVRLNQTFALIVLNGNSRPLEQLVRIPFSYASAKVLNDRGNEVNVTVTAAFAPFFNQFFYRNGNMQANELAFLARVPALGFRTYLISGEPGVRLKSPATAPAPVKPSPIDEATSLVATLVTPMGRPIVVAERVLYTYMKQLLGDETVISNDLIELTFDTRGFLSKYTDKRRQKVLAIRQEFLKYPARSNSGAYIFRPAVNEALPLVDSVRLEVVKNDLFQEVRQQVTDWVSQIVRIFPTKRYVEFDYVVGPLPTRNSVDNLESLDVISRFTVNGFASRGEFWTDSNGRQLMLRRRNFNPDFEFVDREPVSANYYPVNSRILMDNGEERVTLLTDRSQGGSSLGDGQLELMVHRRAFWDDGYGVDEALNEPGDSGIGLVVRGRHWLHVEAMAVTADVGPAHRPLALEMFHNGDGPVLAFAPLTAAGARFDAYAKSYEMSGSLLDDDNAALPPQINVLTLKWLSEEYLLLRLEHIYQNDESAKLSLPVTVDLKKLFAKRLDVLSAEELLLAANRPAALKDASAVSRHNKFMRRRLSQLERRRVAARQRFSASDAASSSSSSAEKQIPIGGSFTIDIHPMEIKTLKVEVARRSKN